MKIMTILKGSKYGLGIQTNLGILDVQEAGKRYETPVPHNVEELILEGKSTLKSLEQLVERALQDTEHHSLFLSDDEVEYGPCITNPGKILCVGLNYRKHAEESNMSIPTSPVLFSKFNNALAAHQSTINIPKLAQQVDYEVELVIVMGRRAHNVSEENALSYVFGYCIGNDLSARDLQFKTGQWLLGKTCDGFAPIGPYIVTTDEVLDPNELDVECRVNGEIRQSSNTKDMIFNCSSIISYISKYMTLEPGDIIFTGTPEGVIMGYPEHNQRWLCSGDEIITSIEKLGSLKVLLN